MTRTFEILRRFQAPNVFNPWTDWDDLDLIESLGDYRPGPDGRLERLKAHFRVEARLVLLGEAPGYQGCHFSGIPFTNEKLLLAGRIPRMSVRERLTHRPRPWCEPSATVVWGALHDLGLTEHTVLWNTFAWHPYKPGNTYSNRAPTRDELQLGREALVAVLDGFPKARVVAVGKVAERTLATLGRTADATLRHPSMGGATEFRAGLTALAAGLKRRSGRS